MISVIIPLYNKEKQVGKAIETVLGQSFQDFEVLVVNDGSTDNSAEVVKSFADPRIRLIEQPNGGVAAARNRGIKEARGKFVAFLDADDEWAPNFLSAIAQLIAKYPQCSVFATNYEFHKANGKVDKTILNKMPFSAEDGILSNYFEVASCSHPPLWTSAITARKEAIEAVGGFPVGIKSGEDLLTWARLAARYKIAYCTRPLAVFNVEGYEVSERPKRLPAEDDVVGRGLIELAHEFNPPFMRQYISLWYKMRSSIYMRLGMRKKSIAEACKGLKYNPLSYKLYAFILINFLPEKLKPF